MKQKPMTVEELLEKCNSDPEWVAAKKERDRKFAEIRMASELAQRPLVDDLKKVGVHIKSAWELVNTKTPYPLAIPVLLNHLNRPYPERVREGIARALAVREAHSGWSTLLDAFKVDPDQSTIGVKWALALALGAAATDAELDDVIPLLRDRSNGENRVPLLAILGRSKDPRADALLLELADEPGIALDVAAVKRKRDKRVLAKKSRAKQNLK